MYPWLVANDKLRAAGWEPTVSNEQAYVEGTESPWWTMLSPKRKQELALGGMGLVGLIAIAVGIWIASLVRGRARERRATSRVV
jgi:hypothetical protein